MGTFVFEQQYNVLARFSGSGASRRTKRGYLNGAGFPNETGIPQRNGGSRGPDPLRFWIFKITNYARREHMGVHMVQTRYKINDFHGNTKKTTKINKFNWKLIKNTQIISNHKKTSNIQKNTQNHLKTQKNHKKT